MSFQAFAAIKPEVPAGLSAQSRSAPRSRISDRIGLALILFVLAIATAPLTGLSRD